MSDIISDIVEAKLRSINTDIEQELKKVKEIGREVISKVSKEEWQSYITLAKDVLNILVELEEEKQKEGERSCLQK